jgi:WD40 repeat protein
LVLAMVGYVTWQSYDVAKRELNVFTARATDALNDEQFDRAIRYALQAYPADGRLLWTTPFSTELEGKLAGGALSTRLHRVLNGHSNWVTSAAFSGDGKRVVTASGDNTARIWDAESGKEIAVLKGHTGIVNSAAFSGDGKRVVTASGDNTARIWDVTWATLVRGDALRERVCAEKLIGAAQEFTDGEIEDDPILRGIDKDDPVARNPCLRRGPLSLDYWTRLPKQLWRSTRRLVGAS